MTSAVADPKPASGSLAAGSPQRRRRTRIPVLPTIILVLVTIVTVVPLAWMFLGSLKDKTDITSAVPKIIFHPTGENYRVLFSTGLWSYIWHSLVASLGSTALSLVLGTPAGYGLARTTMRHKTDLSFWIISVRMAPIAAIALPLFLMFSALGLVNTLPGLILAYATFNLPFCIWLTSAFFAQVPVALEEAAANSGASRWQTFWLVSLPLIKSGLVVTAVLCLVFSWNDFAFATVIAGPDTQTLPIAASQLVTSTGIDWGRMTAIGTVVVIPMFVAGLAVKRWLVTGLTLGAVTGE